MADNSKVEIQVRTDGQDRWGNICEGVAAAVDPGLKYGEGPAEIIDLLWELSDNLNEYERETGLSRDFGRSAHERRTIIESFDEYQRRHDPSGWQILTEGLDAMEKAITHSSAASAALEKAIGNLESLSDMLEEEGN